MYLNRLSNIEKLAFYSIAHELASSHEGISLVEKAILNAALAEMQIQHPEETMSITEALAKFESVQTKRIVLLELMLIALVDDDFAQAEHAIISQAIDYFGFSETLVERGATWAESMLSLFRSGQRFVEFA